jgi:hypothetical protein
MKEAAVDVSHVATAGVSAPRVAAPVRVLFVDWLRCLAAFQMLQGHTIAAVLAPAYRHGALHTLWSSARGLTSVAFLFTAGMSFYFASARDFALPRAQRPLGRRRARRAAWLIVLGYVLHVPIGALFTHDPSVRASLLRSFVAVDVLQCIGASLLLLELCVWRLANARQLAWLCACASAILLGLAPLAARWSAPHALSPLLAYVSSSAGSSFPLLPWAGHLFFGAACAVWLLMPGRLRSELRLLLAAAALLSVSLGVRTLFGSCVVSDHLGRLGCVLLVSALFAWLARRVHHTPRIVMQLARDTLLLYVSHILLIYGQGLGLADRVGRRLAPGPAIGLALLVVAGSSALALGYRSLRNRRLAVTARTG